MKFSSLPTMSSPPRHNPLVIFCYKSFQIFSKNVNTVLFLWNENTLLFCHVIFYLNTLYWTSPWVVIYRPRAHSSNSIIIIYLTDLSVMGIAPVMHGAARNIFPLIFFHTYPFISYEKSPNVELWGRRVCTIYIVVHVANGPPEMS